MKLTLNLLFFLTFHSVLLGQSKNDLNSFINIMLDKNPEINSAYNKYLSQKEKIIQKYSLEDPAISFSYMLNELETKAGPLKSKIAVTQKIPFYGKRKLLKDIEFKKAVLLEQEYNSVKLRLEKELAEAYYSMYFTEKAIKIISEHITILKALSEMLESRYISSKTSQSMIFKINIEIEKLKVKLEEFKFKRRIFEMKINSMLNRDINTKISEIPEFDFKFIDMDKKFLNEIKKHTLKNNPKIIALNAVKDLRISEKKFAIKEFFPDFVISYERSFIKSGTTSLSYDGKDADALMFKVNIPLWYKKKSAQVKEKKYLLDSVSFDLTDLKNKIIWQLESLIEENLYLKSFIKTYKENIIPMAKSTLDNMISGYESDKLNYIDVIDSQRELLRFSLDYENYLKEYMVNIYKLNEISNNFLLKGEVYEE